MPRILGGDELARRYAAYYATGCDAEAADRIGISTTAFAVWRGRVGLKPKGDRKVHFLRRRAVRFVRSPRPPDLSRPFCECGNVIVPGQPHRCIPLSSPPTGRPSPPPFSLLQKHGTRPAARTSGLVQLGPLVTSGSSPRAGSRRKVGVRALI